MCIVYLKMSENESTLAKLILKIITRGLLELFEEDKGNGEEEEEEEVHSGEI